MLVEEEEEEEEKEEELSAIDNSLAFHYLPTLADIPSMSLPTQLPLPPLLPPPAGLPSLAPTNTSSNASFEHKRMKLRNLANINGTLPPPKSSSPMPDYGYGMSPSVPAPLPQVPMGYHGPVLSPAENSLDDDYNAFLHSLVRFTSLLTFFRLNF